MGAIANPQPLLAPFDRPKASCWACRRTCVVGTFLMILAACAGVGIHLNGSSSSSPSSPPSPSPECAPAALTLVQSIPVGNFAIRPVAGALPTHEAFIRLADAAATSLDLTAMYFDLKGTDDRRSHNASAMERFGAGRGAAVYAALERAAARRVAVRLLLGTLNDPVNSPEVRALLRHPTVSARTWDARRWYEGGIMHLKLWHSDRRVAYVGSANADWKSLAQVKEMGVLVNGSRATADLGRVFEAFWRWTAPDVEAKRLRVPSGPFQAQLTLPPWDINVPAAERRVDSAPFGLSGGSPLAALSNISRQQPLCGATAAGGDAAAAFVTASPGGAVTAGRTFDEDGLVYTIRSATRSLSLSVMDFLPASEYSGGHGGSPVRWPALVDAALAVAFARPVRVRVLVSRWAHTNALIAPAMEQLANGLAACATGHQPCAGSLEVRQFEVCLALARASLSPSLAPEPLLWRLRRRICIRAGGQSSVFPTWPNSTWSFVCLWCACSVSHKGLRCWALDVALIAVTQMFVPTDASRIFYLKWPRKALYGQS